MKMETAHRHQRLIRAVYPNGNNKRGYHMLLTTQDANRFAISYWLTRWASKLMPQKLAGY